MPKSKSSKKRAKRKQKSLPDYLQIALNEDLRQLRKSLSTLKRLGLAFTRTNVRKKPKGTKRQRTIVAAFADILSGKAKAYKVGPKAKDFADSGKRVVNNKIILPVEENVKIVTRKGHVYRHRQLKGGKIRSEILPVKTTNLTKYIDELRTSGRKPQKNKKFAFRFYGNNSFMTFDNLDLLAGYFEQYKSVQAGFTGKKKNQQEIIENLEIIEVTKDVDLVNVKGGYKRYPRHNSPYNCAYYEQLRHREPARFAEKIEKAKQRYQERKNDNNYMEHRRLKERERYAKLKKNRNT